MAAVELRERIAASSRRHRRRDRCRAGQCRGAAADRHRALRRRRRGRARLAFLRGLPDPDQPGRRPPGRRSRCAPTRATTSTRWRRPSPTGPGSSILCSPNNPTGVSIGAAELDRFLAQVPAARARRAGRGLRRVRHPPRHHRRDGAVPRPPPTSSCCGPSPRPTAWPGCGSGTPSRTRTSPTACAAPGSLSRSAVSPSGRPSRRSTRRPRCGSGWPRSSPNAAGSPTPSASAGWEVPDSEANFVWLRTDDDLRTRLVDAMADADILVRGYAGDGVRISLADRAANDRVLAVLDRPSAFHPLTGPPQRPRRHEPLRRHRTTEGLPMNRTTSTTTLTAPPLRCAPRHSLFEDVLGPADRHPARLVRAVPAEDGRSRDRRDRRSGPAAQLCWCRCRSAWSSSSSTCRSSRWRCGRRAWTSPSGPRSRSVWSGCSPSLHPLAVDLQGLEPGLRDRPRQPDGRRRPAHPVPPQGAASAGSTSWR